MEIEPSSTLEREIVPAAAGGVLLETPPLDARGQMALDELLLAGVFQKEPFVLRFYRWKRPAATFGYFQKWKEAHVLASDFLARHAEADLVRRPTGGGFVLHETDATFSLVFSDGRFLPPLAVYQKIHEGVQLGLHHLGVLVWLWGRGGPGETGPSPSRCFQGPSQMDLVTEGGRKILGGALRRQGDRVLYQGSLRLGSLEGLAVPAEEVRSVLAEGLREQWKTELRAEPVSSEALALAGDLAERKYASEEWNKKR